MTLSELTNMIDCEIQKYLVENESDLSEELMIETNILLGELLNPDNSYEYEGSKGWFHYNDINKNTYFVRLAYQPTLNPFFELKTGWYDSNNVPQYDPPIAPNTTALDWDKRSNTVAKIYRDEIIPFFISQNLSDTMIFNPISTSRYNFSIRLIKKFTPEEFKIEEYYPKQIKIFKI